MVSRAIHKAKSFTSVTESVGKVAKNLLLETRVEYDDDDNRMMFSPFPWMFYFHLEIPFFLVPSLPV